MKLPDDMELKAEIESISKRIDHILDTVQQLYPVCETDFPDDAQPDRDQKNYHRIPNQKPEQEA